MQVPVIVDAENGRFSASVAGVPELRASAATRDEALAELSRLIHDRMRQGTFTMLDVPERNIMDLFGVFKDDETLQEICDEAYRLRDAERAALDRE